MQFIETELPGAFIIVPEHIEDQRGFFARAYCDLEFQVEGVEPPRWVQCNISYSHKRGTLRGMHYQAAPYAEFKLVRCTAGAIYDVAVDLRPDSPTYRRHVGVELTQENRRMLYVPQGFAHGFLTLADDTEVFYQMSEFYEPEAAAGFRYDDPAFRIPWPADPQVISDRDRTYPDFKD